MRAAARLRGRQQRHADLQPAVDGGYRPRPRRSLWASRRSRCRTRCSAPTAAPGVGDLRARQPVLGDPGSAARNTSARPMRFPSSICARPAARWCRWTAVVRTNRQTGPLQHQPLRPIAGGDHLVQPAARILAGTGGAAGGRRHPRSAHAGHHQLQLPGHGEGVPELLPEPLDPADGGHPGDLHRAGHSVRELHPSHHDSLRTALGGIRRAADAGAVPQAARPVRVRRHHHAVRRGEEERHHDDRFRHRRAEARAQRRTMPSGRAACCASAPS